MSEVDLNVALEELHIAVTRPDFVRAVFSGRRRNMQVEHERVDLRPVQLKDSIAIQVSFSDGRQMTSKNYAIAELSFF